MRALLLVLAIGCGEAEIIAPESLSVLDTSPGNGSVILPGETPIAILFSEDVVSDRIEDAVTLEETTEQGSAIRQLPLSLDSYDAETFTAVLRTEPLPPATIYALTISSEEMQATSGARMQSDLIRRFRTAD
jgi:hypothetical protein